MKTRYIITLIALATTLTIAMQSCHSGKSSVRGGSQSESTATGAMTVKDARRQLAHTIESYGRWQTVKMPVTIRLREPKSLTISGTATMERDKSLTISLRFFGMEVGSLSVASDSITVIDRINKAYFKDDVTALLDGFPATVGNLQDLLLGRVFEPGSTGVKASNFEVSISGSPDMWTAIGKLPEYNLNYGYSFCGMDPLKALVVMVGDKSPVMFAYDDFYSSTAGMFAGSVSIVASAENNTIDATVEWNFRKAAWNSSDFIQDKSKIPSGYSRISPDAVVKMLKNL